MVVSGTRRLDYSDYPNNTPIFAIGRSVCGNSLSGIWLVDAPGGAASSTPRRFSGLLIGIDDRFVEGVARETATGGRSGENCTFTA